MKQQIEILLQMIKEGNTTISELQQYLKVKHYTERCGKLNYNNPDTSKWRQEKF